MSLFYHQQQKDVKNWDKVINACKHALSLYAYLKNYPDKEIEIMLILSEIYYTLKMIISSGNELDKCEKMIREYQQNKKQYADSDRPEDPLRDPWILW